MTKLHWADLRLWLRREQAQAARDWEASKSYDAGELSAYARYHQLGAVRRQMTVIYGRRQTRKPPK